ncbi:unnamed protein product [Parajaminaea phylloscopi]
MDRQVVRDWLRSVLTQYADPQRTFADIIAALDALPSLSPRTDLYISNEGHSSLLLHLKGTLPITFRGSTYNIPVQIWIPRAYPREAPTGYVVPTRDMLVRKTSDVDLDGSIAGEYYLQWSRKWETKSVLSYLDACRDMFSQQPPVYAKPPEQAAQRVTTSSPSLPPTSSAAVESDRRSPSLGAAQATSERGPAQKPPPPLPGSPAAVLDQSGSQQLPQRPPKPLEHQRSSSRSSSGNWGPGIPYGTTSQPVGLHGHPVSSGHRGPQPAAGSHPSQDYARRNMGAGPPQAFQAAGSNGWSSPILHQQPLRSHSGTFAESVQYAQASGGPGFANPATRPSSQASQAPPSRPHHPAHPQFHPPQGGPAPQQAPNAPLRPLSHDSRQNTAPGHTPQTLQHGPQSSTSMPPQSPQQSRDLLDALDEDQTGFTRPTGSDSRSGLNLGPGQGANLAGPPPVRPPNPEVYSLHLALHEKISSRIATLRSQLAASNSHLAVISSDLDRGPSAIEDESARLCAVRDVCRSRAERLESTVAQAKAVTQELRAREGKVDSKEVVLADSIVGDQLIGLVSADLALTDLLYHLGRALGSESLDLERYLKWVRMCGREQFLKRALAAKIQAGLESMGSGGVAVNGSGTDQTGQPVGHSAGYM